jgi:hypothetical protein
MYGDDQQEGARNRTESCGWGGEVFFSNKTEKIM